MEQTADSVAAHVDLERLARAASPARPPEGAPPRLPPLGRRIAVAANAAFAFCYPHMLEDWRRQGAEISFFSPLANESPLAGSGAIYLPGGYPELHAARLVEADRFREAMRAAAVGGVRIYGEGGGYMALGDALTDAEGRRWPMLGLLPIETRMTLRRTALGYRRLRPLGDAPFAGALLGHEFHYAEIVSEGPGPSLFRATDAAGRDLGAIGRRRGSVSGSFAHIIAPEPETPQQAD